MAVVAGDDDPGIYLDGLDLSQRRRGSSALLAAADSVRGLPRPVLGASASRTTTAIHTDPQAKSADCL
jgi:hypothetical protein